MQKQVRTMGRSNSSTRSGHRSFVTGWTSNAIRANLPAGLGDAPGGGGVIGRTTELRRTLPALIASIPITIVYFAVLGIVLTAAGPDGLDLTDAQTSGWIAVLYGLPTLIALVMTVRFHQPLLITGNIFAIIFFVSLGDRISFPELAGASMLAGAIVLAAA